MRLFGIRIALAIAFAWSAAVAGGEVAVSRVPAWDARGLGIPPRQGVACISVSADGKHIVVGTIAPAGEPNVIVLDDGGKVIARHSAGQRWIQDVAAADGGATVFALCTMPEGRANDAQMIFRCAQTVERASDALNEYDYPWTLFHYGAHSNHTGIRMQSTASGAAASWRNAVVWFSNDARGISAKAPLQLPENACNVSFAAAPGGECAAGFAVPAAKGAKPANNLFLVAPGGKAPLFVRAAKGPPEAAPPIERGFYGTPTGADGAQEIAQEDHEIVAPLSLAVLAGDDGSVQRFAAADYGGWQRRLNYPAANAGRRAIARFPPAKPVISVYDRAGTLVREFSAGLPPAWLDLKFAFGGKMLLAYPHSWAARGLAGQPFLPADDEARRVFLLDIEPGTLKPVEFPDAVADAVEFGDALIVSCWDGRIYKIGRETRKPLAGSFDAGGPCLLSAAGKSRIIAGSNGGVVRALDSELREIWRKDLNAAVPPTEKAWVKNAAAEKVAPGLWRLPGGRVESDLGGQYLIEAPEGLILIEAHSGLSFEREWAAIEKAGLDPRRVKYILATHEHGDHAPGAYLWRVATGAQFVCSDAMAYALQHNIPIGLGYGFHPPVPTDIRVSEDKELNLAGLPVRALRTPGHTFGSMGWFFEKGGKRFVSIGDQIMPRGVLGFSGSVGFSARDVLASLRKLDALKPDYILPGHGPITGPDNYVGAGIEVGRRVGWGFMPPEAPDPYFRITQKNVIVCGFGCNATSGAFGDVNADGRPDVALVSPSGNDSIVRIFLNKNGRFDAMSADYEIPVPGVAEPSKIRLCKFHHESLPDICIGGRSAAVLAPRGAPGEYAIKALDAGDLHAFFAADLDGDGVKEFLTARRFGVVERIVEKDGRLSLVKAKPELRGPFPDARSVDLNGDGAEDLVSNYGGVWLRGKDGKFSEQPTQQLAPPDPADWSFLGAGDFNADGRRDIALGSYGAKRKAVHVFYNTGRAGKPFDDAPAAALNIESQKTHVRDAPAVVDWNGDGADDLLIGMGQENRVRVFLGAQDGLAEKRVEVIELDFFLHYDHGFYAADFDGDGKPDLAVFGYTNTGVGAGGPPAAYIWLNPGGVKQR